MFRGISGANLDAKGRMVIPARYRDDLRQAQRKIVVLTVDTEERCLLLYSLLEWEEIEKKIVALPSFDSATRRIQRLLIGHATDVEIDDHGRILLPALLREYAHLTRRVVLVGQGKKIELWEERHWQHTCNHWLEEESSAKSIGLPEALKLISL